MAAMVLGYRAGGGGHAIGKGCFDVSEESYIMVFPRIMEEESRRRLWAGDLYH